MSNRGKGKKKNKVKKLQHQRVNLRPIAHQYDLKTRFALFSAKFQDPNNDEPEDLLDDLAPKVQTPNVAPPLPSTAPSGSQPKPGFDNKLNFKFQKTTQKTPDWTKYQNNFKRISAASPDTDPEEMPAENEKPKTTEVNIETPTTSEASQPASDVYSALPPSVMKIVQEKLKLLPTHKTPIIMPKMDEPIEETPKPVEQKVIPTTSKPTGPTFQQNQKLNPKYNFPKQTAIMTPFDYPKGIPKSFLVLRDQELKTQHEINAQQKVKEEIIVPPNPVTPMPGLKGVSEQKMLAALDLPSWIMPAASFEEQKVAQQLTGIYDDIDPNIGANAQTLDHNEPIPDRPYSPSDAYNEATGKVEEDVRDGSESPEGAQSGQKRLSAFKRLGPLNIAKPKKPKLTINLMLNKEQAVREVVDEGSEANRFVPVHLRRDVIESQDETVKTYLPFWPWKKNVTARKTVTARFSKSVMILEQEQMEAGYEKDSWFIQVTVKRYPASWTKEDVLDAILEGVKGKSFIPCFIEFTPQECKFLVIRCRPALIAIHKMGFHIRKNDIELTVFISLTDLSLNQIDMIPRLALRKRLMMHYDGEKKLDLTSFFTEKDVSNFLYFPLNRVTNQVELIQLGSAVNWEYLTDLNLSKNRLTTLDGFDLQTTTPRLRNLDLSHNYLDKMTLLLRCRYLPLRSIRLEGNPLCHDYVDGGHYVKVLKMMFSELREIDGVPLTLRGDFPPPKTNYCPEAATGVIEKFLETFFPLLEVPYDERAGIEDLYDEEAVMTVTFRYKIRYSSSYRYFRNLFLRARNFDEGELESVRGAPSIGSLINKWPPLQHDRFTFTVDVLHCDDSTIIFRVGGILKLTAESLAEDEHLLTFTRNIVLHTKNGTEYKIHNEMLYWDVPSEEGMKTAFNITTVRPKVPTLKLESPPVADLKSNLLSIFVKLADIDVKRAERCLEIKNWDLRSALDYYIKLLKLDDLSSLKPLEATPEPVSQAT